MNGEGEEKKERVGEGGGEKGRGGMNWFMSLFSKPFATLNSRLKVI